jgi:hypothetical protein
MPGSSAKEVGRLGTDLVYRNNSDRRKTRTAKGHTAPSAKRVAKFAFRFKSTDERIDSEKTSTAHKPTRGREFTARIESGGAGTGRPTMLNTVMKLAAKAGIGQR